MKVIPLLLLPAAVLLVSACAPEVVEPHHGYYGGSGPGPGYVVATGGPGYYDHRDGYDRHDGNAHRYSDTNRTENDVTVNRTNVNERTLNINKTNVNQANATRQHGKVTNKKVIRKGDGKPNEEQGPR